MDKRLNILVIGVSGNVSIGILKAIRKSSFSNYKLFGACVTKIAAGFAFCDESILCPFANNNSFHTWLSKIEKDFDIDVVLSGVEEVLEVLSIRPQNGKVKYLVSNPEDIKTFNNKFSTAEWLKKHALSSPRTIDLGKAVTSQDVLNNLEKPFIIKPKFGKGSKDILIVKDASQFLSYLGNDKFVAQELIGDEKSEYTCGVYKSKFNYIEVIIMKRTLKHGSTSTAEVVQHSMIETYCRDIAKHLKTNGSFNIQLRVCGQRAEPFCFELNMRQSGTTAIRHTFGFKDCEAWITEEVFNTKAKHLFSTQPGFAIRFEEEAYFTKETLDKIALFSPTPANNGLRT